MARESGEEPAVGRAAGSRGAARGDGAWRRELGQAARRLRRRPGYPAGAVAVLAAGIAATLGGWALIEGTLLRPLPFARADRLVALDVISTRGFGISASIPNLRDWRDRSRSFDAYTGSAGWSFVFSGRGPAEGIGARAVLGPFFETLGLRPQAGRLFTGEETGPGAPHVAVLGDAFWRRRLGGDPSVIGQTLTLDGTPFLVTGILAPGAGYPSPGVELYFPMGSLAASLPWDDRDSSFGTRVLARLAPGVSLAQAQGDLDRVTDAVAAEIGQPMARPRVRPLADLFVGEQRSTYALIGAILGCFLAIALVNVLLLAVARAEQRRPEMAVRSALGASARQNRRMLAIEGLLLAALGTALGIGLGALLLRAGSFWIRQSVPALLVDRLALGPTSWAVATALGAIAALLLGFLPGRSSGLAGRAATARGRRLDPRSLLVGAEVALTLLLVALASLLARSEVLVGAVDRGFDGRAVWSARLSAPDGHYPSGAAFDAAWRSILEETRALPGVRATAATLMLPLTGRSSEMRVLPAGRAWDPHGADSMLFNAVTPDYFRTLGVPLVRGRGFGAEDRADGPLVAVVDESLAERYWPGQDPIGQAISMDRLRRNGDQRAVETRVVIGVARNVRHYELESASRIQVYVPLSQATALAGSSLYLLVGVEPETGTAAGAEALTTAVRQRLAAVDPDLATTDISMVEARIDRALGDRRATRQLASFFGVLSLGLALAGVFALTSYAVEQRKAEFGIRAALGASRRDLLGQVLRRALVQSAGGALAGAALAALGAPLVRSLLFGVGPFDPRGIGAALAVVLVAAALAALLPAWRAARLDPARVLRPGDRLSG